MSDLTVFAFNTTSTDFQLVTFVGGIVPTNGANYTPIIWNLAPFPQLGPTGLPYTTIVSWPQTYGLSVLSSHSSTVAPVWTATTSLDGLPLGSIVTVSYNPVSGTYFFSRPSAGGPVGTLTVKLDSSIPVNPSKNVSIGVNINGSPTGFLDPKYIQPNLVVSFLVRPIYSIAATQDQVLGLLVAQSVATGSLVLDFSGGSSVTKAILLPDLTWRQSTLEVPKVPRPTVSISISPYGQLTLDVFHPAIGEATEKEGEVGKHLSLPGRA